MSRFWDGLAKIGLVERVEVQPQQELEPGPVPVTENAPKDPMMRAVRIPPEPAPPVKDTRLAALDAAAKERLVTAMQNDGAPLVEELTDNLDTLAEAIPAENARYTTALKMLAKRGISVDSVLSDYDKCLGALEQSYRTFEAESKTQAEARVGTKVRQVEALQAEITTKTAEIDRMQLEAQTLSIAIADEQEKITSVQSRFLAVYTSIQQEVNKQRDLVARYGK